MDLQVWAPEKLVPTNTGLNPVPRERLKSRSVPEAAARHNDSTEKLQWTRTEKRLRN